MASCSICCENFRSADDISITTCHHVFHANCFQDWANRNQTCPQCRYEHPQLTRIYLNFEDQAEIDRRIAEMRSLMSSQKEDFDEKLTNIKIELEQTIINCSHLQCQLDANENDMNHLKREMEERIMLISQLEGNENNYKIQLEDNIIKIGELEQNKEDTEEQIKDLKFALERSTLNAARLEQNLEKSERKVTELSNQLEENILNSSCLEHEKEKCKRENNVFQENVNDQMLLFQQEAETMKEEIIALKSRLEDADIKMKTLRDVNKEISNALPATLTSKLQHSSMKIAKLEFELDKCQNAYRTDIKEMRENLLKKTDEVAKLQKRLQENEAAAKKKPYEKTATSANIVGALQNADRIFEEKIKFLEEKVKQFSDQLQKEITKNIELTIENMKLQTLLNHNNCKPTSSLNNEMMDQQRYGFDIFTCNNSNRNSNNSNSKKNISKRHHPQRQKSVDDDNDDLLSVDGSISGLSIPDLVVNSIGIVIRGLPMTVNNSEAAEKCVLHLANLMMIPCTSNDLEKCYVLENNFKMRRNIEMKKISIVVKFKTNEMEENFLKNKDKLKNFPDMKQLTIHEYATDSVYSLYHHAKQLRNIGYKNVFCKRNCVFAKKDQGSKIERIMHKYQVDELLKNANIVGTAAAPAAPAAAPAAAAAAGNNRNVEDSDLTSLSRQLNATLKQCDEQFYKIV